MSQPRYLRSRNHRRPALASLTSNQTAITEYAALAGGPGTGLYDVTLEAQIGDTLEAFFSARLAAVAIYTGFDLYTMPAGVRTNPFGQGLSAALGSLIGVPAWLAPNTAANPSVIAGSAFRTVVAGDLNTDARTVTVRLYVAASAVTARLVDLPTLFVRNIGPADPE